MKKDFYFSLICVLILIICATPGCDTPASIQTEENKEIVRGFVEAMNNREFNALDSLVAQDLVRHSQATPNVQVRSREEFKAFLEQDFAAVPDARQEIQMMIAEDDKVAVYVTYSGTQDGQLGPFPPTGKQFELNFIGILRIENDQIAEIWVEWDNLSALTQLGHFPPDTIQTE